MLQNSLILMFIGLTLVFFFLFLLILFLKFSNFIIIKISKIEKKRDHNKLKLEKETLKHIAIEMAMEKYLLTKK